MFSMYSAGVETLLKTLHVLFGGGWGDSADSSFRALTDMICLVQLNVSIRRTTVIHEYNLKIHKCSKL